MLFDLTNFYFEGRKERSPKAQYGRSKEKRNDCKLLVIALCVNAIRYKLKQTGEKYISTFTTLTLLMGVVFLLPVIAFALAKLGFITADMMSRYRKYSLIVIMLVAAIITPPDLMTLILVTLPLYLLYELSIRVAKWVD